MSALARILLDAGLTVVGTDLRNDPPTGPALAQWGVDVRLGYDPSHLDDRPDLVVVGNAVTSSNAVALAAIERGIPVTHMPALLDRLVGTRQRIVIAGTHGKSTTATATAWLLQECGLDPGWMIGATPQFGPSGRLGTGPFVFEGDEYNAAYFDRGAKFLHYRPDLLAITNIEFDHADLYADLEAVEAAFHRLVNGIPVNGLAIVTPESSHAARQSPAPVVNLEPPLFEYLGSGTAGSHCRLDGHDVRFPMPGRHGAIDGAMALLLAVRAGADPDQARSALGRFPGLRLRQEVLADGRVTVIRDFGHHPTEIAATLSGLRDAWPDRPIWAAFEPRSYTSRTNRFQEQYAGAFAAADRVWIAPVHAPERLSDPPLDTARLATNIGPDARWFESLDQLATDLERDVLAASGSVMLIFFSNGTMNDVPETIARVVK